MGQAGGKSSNSELSGLNSYDTHWVSKASPTLCTSKLMKNFRINYRSWYCPEVHVHVHSTGNNVANQLRARPQCSSCITSLPVNFPGMIDRLNLIIK